MKYGKYILALFLSLMLLGGTVYAAEKWPTEPITIIVPFGPGGGVDTMTRGLVQFWQKHLGVPIAVENMEGGLAMVGLKAFMKKPDDGQTILVMNQTKLSGGYVLEGEDYKLEDFAFINNHMLDPDSIVVNVNSKYQTLQDLIEDIKARPGEIAMGTTIQTAGHLGALLLSRELDLDVREVNYSSGSDMRIDLIGNHIDFMVSYASTDYPFKDEIRELAVFTDERFPLYPETPTINESLKPYNVTLPTGLGSLRMFLTLTSFKEKYPDRWNTLVETYKATMEDPEYIAFIKKSGEFPVTAYHGEEKSYKANKALEQTLIKYKDLFVNAK